MGIFNFWKKNEEPEIGADKSALDLGLDTNPMDPLGQSHNDMDSLSKSSNMMNDYGSVNLSTMGMNSMNNQSFQQPFNQPQGNQGIEKDIQILSLKLDAIKSEMDSINQRIKNIESIAEKEQQTTSTQKRWY